MRIRVYNNHLIEITRNKAASLLFTSLWRLSYVRAKENTMSTVENQAITIAPGAGTKTWLLGDTYTLKLAGTQTAGAFALLEAVVPPGGGPPSHIHYAEDETFVILEGEIIFTTDEGTIAASTGTVVHVPKGTKHSYATVGTVPVRMLFLYVPAGMEGMFDEIGTPAQPGVAAPPSSPEDVAKLLAVAAKYNFAVVPPEAT
jgi:mannose-6-phosphate isomerase-like protein (cupin superfamily)